MLKKERRFVEEGKASKLPQVCVTVQFGGESELGALQIERFESGVGVLLGLSAVVMRNRETNTQVEQTMLQPRKQFEGGWNV